MAKCPVCNSKKGKRKCIAYNNDFLCPQCCGEVRESEKCDGCSYYKNTASIRNYKEVPYFSLSQMSNSSRLEGYTNVIESAICRFDLQYEQSINDAIVQKTLEFVMSRYHFKDETIGFSNPLEEEGFKIMDIAITEGLSALSPDDLSRTLGTVHRSILRHKGYNAREYIDFIHTYVGPGGGLRVLQGKG